MIFFFLNITINNHILHIILSSHLWSLICQIKTIKVNYEDQRVLVVFLCINLEYIFTKKNIHKIRCLYWKNGIRKLVSTPQKYYFDEFHMFCWYDTLSHLGIYLITIESFWIWVWSYIIGFFLYFRRGGGGEKLSLSYCIGRANYYYLLLQESQAQLRCIKIQRNFLVLPTLPYLPFYPLKVWIFNKIYDYFL